MEGSETVNTGKDKAGEETIAVNILNLLQEPVPQPEKETAKVTAATPLSKRIKKSATAESVVPQTESRDIGVSVPPMPEAAVEERDKQIYLEVNRITKQQEYEDITGSSPRKLRFLLRRLQAPDDKSEVAQVALVPVDISEGMRRLFNIDEIPELSVWHGSQCEFLVDWMDNPAADFSFTAEPSPEGKMQLERSPGEDNSWCYRYAPAKNDKFPITVKITAVSGEQSTTHSFEMTPMPNLTLEQTVFGTTGHTQPGPVDFHRPETTEELIEHTYMQDKAFVFNYKRPSIDANLSLRAVKILGESVVFDKDNDEFGLYTMYNDVRDVENMELTAKRVIIRSPLHLHQTNVTINAQELSFEGATAQIKTTPIEKSSKPNAGLPGEDGSKAGNVTLNISQFTADDAAQSVNRLDLTGGKGQAGGDGKDGTAGARMPSYGNRMEWTDSGIRFGKTAPAGYHIIYKVAYCTCAMGIPIKAFSHGNPQGWPSDGTSATASGKPGEGGAGGKLISTYDVSASAAVGGGQAGAAATNPRGHYRGGSAGSPTKSIRYSANYCLAASFKELGRNDSKAGNNADILYAKSPFGGKGHCVTGGSSCAWLDPVLVNKLLNRVKDDYLANRLETSASTLEEHIQAIDDYKADASWQTIDDTKQIEIEQIYDEMQIMLHRIRNNLDYFGHPAGWVPLLSFEINRTIFDNEIDSAADILYYAYCIKNKAATAEKRFESLASMRKQLEKDITTSVSQFNDTIAKIPLLRTAAENLLSRTLEAQYKLQAKETDLAQQAEEKLRPPAWLVGARLGLKISGTIVSMIPVYQPAMGAIGGGLNLLSDFDPDKPWDTIIGGVDVTSQFLNSSFESATKDLKNEMDKEKLKKADPSGGMRTKMKYLNAARKSSSALSTGLGDLQGFIQKNSAPQSEIDTELEKLKSQSTEYRALVEEIKELLKRKADFAEKLAAAMQEVSTLSNFVTRSILAMDAMNVDMKQVQEGLDRRAVTYVDDMERRAYDRLLEYHYYMAKAYEYRILRPYNKPLDFKQLIKRLEKVARVKAWDELDSATFRSTYTAVYKERLSEMANDIFRDYNNKLKEESNKFGYLLSAEELDELNASRTVSVNLARYLPNEENLRMVNIGIQLQKDIKRKGHIETSPVGSAYARNTYLDLTFTHPSISKIRSSRDIYQFQHPFLDGQNPLVWKARYEPESDAVTHSVPSAASASLLMSLLKGDALSDLMIYSRPSVLTDLQIAKNGYPNNGADIKIDRLKLELTYDYFESTDNLIDKHLLVTAIEPGEGTSLKVSEASFEPYFIIDREDTNRRQDARGKCLRVYQRVWDGHVILTAQPTYGNYMFNKWTDVTGDELPNSEGTTVSLDLKSDQMVCAQYIASEIAKKEVKKQAFAIPRATAFTTFKEKDTEIA